MPVFYSSNQFAGLAPVPNHHFDPGPSEHLGYLTSSASYTSSPYYHRDAVLYAYNVNSMQRDVLALPSEPPDPAPYAGTEPNYCSSGTPLHAQYIPKQSWTNNNTPAPLFTAFLTLIVTSPLLPLPFRGCMLRVPVNSAAAVHATAVLGMHWHSSRRAIWARCIWCRVQYWLGGCRLP